MSVEHFGVTEKFAPFIKRQRHAKVIQLMRAMQYGNGARLLFGRIYKAGA
jgi:hypothetical protein